MKNNYYSLKEKLFYLDNSEAISFIEDFFDEDKLDDYYISDQIDEDSKRAIYELFKKDDIENKINNALSFDGLCSEALLIMTYVFEDVIAYSKFQEARANINFYDSLSHYKKFELIEDYDLFTDFLADLSNIKYAITVKKEIMNVKDNNYYDITKLALYYGLIEDGDKLLELLEKYDQDDAFVYLVTLVTLLKEQREDDATYVLNDMINEFKEADYIDHLWDLDNSEDSETFTHNVEDAMDFIAGVPYFFSWCYEHKSNKMQS